MVDEFEKWVSSHQNSLKEKGVSIEFKRRETPSVAAVAILESESVLASVSVWDHGSCDVHMIRSYTGEAVFAKRYDFTSFDQVLPVLEEVCHRMTAK